MAELVEMRAPRVHRSSALLHELFPCPERDGPRLLLGSLWLAKSAFAVALAVLVGAPAYIDGYAALPLTRALMEAGMASGAAMAFLVSGGVISIWGAMAIAPVLRLQPFLLYLLLASLGSMLAEWASGAWMGTS